MSEILIEARGLKKRYGSTIAVDGIDLTVHRGEIFGLLGPNGAGKTTAILMLLGLTEADEGRISVCGADPMRDPLTVKERVAYLPDMVGFYDNLSARANLRYTGRLAGIAARALDGRIDGALSRVRLDTVADHKVGTYSRGMRQRLGIAEILMKGAQAAILDEPTNGLDPQSTFELLDMIRTLRDDGMAIMLSSHILDRVQAICDRVALFSGGRIAIEGSVRELAAQVLGGGYTLKVDSDMESGALAALLGSVDGVSSVQAEEPGRFRVLALRDVRDAVARAMVNAGAPILRLASVEPSLDEIYRRYFEEINGTAHVTA
ncbi:MAG: ABC transporter ATP-binding protein [Betaproteobacteria bacterium RIFCSPLOWO2_12_FULL_62_13b]|nr:MAG: ABC transporter ATP-binding protein [Betaproteobacteria bacterium RIFCSPLOWO2_12_FULL_62_13b]